MEPTDFRKALGERIRACRDAQNLSQDRLAKMIGGTSDGSYISRIERGKVSVSVDNLYKIALALNIKVHDLVNLDKSISSMIK